VQDHRITEAQLLDPLLQNTGAAHAIAADHHQPQLRTIAAQCRKRLEDLPRQATLEDRPGRKPLHIDSQRHHGQPIGRHGVPFRHKIGHGGGVGENPIGHPRRAPRQETPAPSLTWPELQREDLEAEIVHGDDGWLGAAEGESVGGTEKDIQIVPREFAGHHHLLPQHSAPPMTRKVRDGGPAFRRRRGEWIALKEQVPLDTVVPPRETLEHPLQITPNAGAAAFHFGGNDPNLHAAHRTSVR